VNRNSVGVIVISLAIGILIGVEASTLFRSQDPEQLERPDLAYSVPATVEQLREFLPEGSIRLDAHSDDGDVYTVVATFFDSRRPPIELADDLEAALTSDLDEILGLETTDLGESGARISIVYREPTPDGGVVLAHANIAKEADGENQSRYTISLTVAP
jgi:hypothetical protein